MLPNTSLIPPLIDTQQLQANLSSSITNSLNSTLTTNSTVSKTLSVSGLNNSNNQIQNSSQIMQQQQQPQQQQQQQPPLQHSQAPPPPPLMAQKITMLPDVPFPPPPINSMISINQSNQPQTQQYNNLINTNVGSTQYQQQLAVSAPQIPSHNFPQGIIPPNTSGANYNTPPPSFTIPDLSKPPPGFSSTAPPSQPSLPMPEEEVKPTAPYYELPAGLMVPLIRLEDYSYKPLDPNDVRLPPPAPQSERLSSAIVAFYSLPSHDRPRDV